MDFGPKPIFSPKDAAKGRNMIDSFFVGKISYYMVTPTTSFRALEAKFWHLRCWTRVSNAHRTSAPWGPCEHSTILSCTITTISLLLYSAVLHCPAHLLYLPCPSPPHIQHPFYPPSTNHTKPLPNQPPSSIVSINQKGGESEGRGTKSIGVLQ